MERAVLCAIGDAYAEGRLSIAEVAAALDLPVSDAVAVLEEHGFRRTVERLRLSDVARAERLSAIRAERIARGNRPVTSPDLVRREVVATQRIEGVDARIWVRT